MLTILRTLSCIAIALLAMAGLRLWHSAVVSRSSSFNCSIHRHLSTLRFDGAFNDMVSQCEMQTGIHVVVSKAAVLKLQDSLRLGGHLTESSPPRIHAQLYDVDALAALQDAINQFSSELALCATDGYIEIITLESRPLELRVYDVSDLARASKEIGDHAEPTPPISAASFTRSNRPNLTTANDIVDALLYRHNIRGWSRNDALIKSVDEELVVLERPEVHQRIIELLRLLREANAQDDRKELGP